MRRNDREITEQNKMMEILSACECCRLGLIDENGAYIVPLNFGYEEVEGKIFLYFHGAADGKKFDLIRMQKKLPLSWIENISLQKVRLPARIPTYTNLLWGMV